jgi:hypothetical protein
MYQYDRRASQDVVIEAVSFVRSDYALPELLEHAQPFKLHPSVTFVLGGPLLARALGQPEESLGEFLRGKTKDELFPALLHSKELLAALTPLVLSEIVERLLKHTPNLPEKTAVAYSDSSQRTLKVNIRKRFLLVSMRFDVSGE